MFDRVLGVDPGTASTGLAVVAGGARARVAWARTVRTKAGGAEPDRLRELHRAVAAAIEEHEPEGMAVERLMWGRNVGSAMGVARATGVILLAAAERGLPVFEYAPLEVKMAVAGSGSASKAELRRALERVHRVEQLPSQPDETDAVAIALCHLHRARMLAATARAKA